MQAFGELKGVKESGILQKFYYAKDIISSSAFGESPARTA
jgi:hypothetical protein